MSSTFCSFTEVFTFTTTVSRVLLIFLYIRHRSFNHDLSTVIPWWRLWLTTLKLGLHSLSRITPTPFYSTTYGKIVGSSTLKILINLTVFYYPFPPPYPMLPKDIEVSFSSIHVFTTHPSTSFSVGYSLHVETCLRKWSEETDVFTLKVLGGDGPGWVRGKSCMVVVTMGRSICDSRSVRN